MFPVYQKKSTCQKASCRRVHIKFMQEVEVLPRVAGSPDVVASGADLPAVLLMTCWSLLHLPAQSGWCFAPGPFPKRPPLPTAWLLFSLSWLFCLSQAVSSDEKWLPLTRNSGTDCRKTTLYSGTRVIAKTLWPSTRPLIILSNKSVKGNTTASALTSLFL